MTNYVEDQAHIWGVTVIVWENGVQSIFAGMQSAA